MYILKNIFKKNHNIEFLGVIIILLFIVTAFMFKEDAYKNSLILNQTVVCSELDDNKCPVENKDYIKHGTRNVCLWMKYKSPRVPRELTLQWRCNNKVILTENLIITNLDGIKAFYFMREDGAPLPAGRYRVVISDGFNLLREIPFTIKKLK